MKRWIVAPFRLLICLPPFYGMTVLNRIQQIGRRFGLYTGPINHRMKVAPGFFGLFGKEI